MGQKSCDAEVVDKAKVQISWQVGNKIILFNSSYVIGSEVAGLQRGYQCLDSHYLFLSFSTHIPPNRQQSVYNASCELTGSGFLVSFECSVLAMSTSLDSRERLRATNRLGPSDTDWPLYSYLYPNYREVPSFQKPPALPWIRYNLSAKAWNSTDLDPILPYTFLSSLVCIYPCI